MFKFSTTPLIFIFITYYYLAKIPYFKNKFHIYMKILTDPLQEKKPKKSKL